MLTLFDNVLAINHGLLAIGAACSDYMPTGSQNPWLAFAPGSDDLRTVLSKPVDAILPIAAKMAETSEWMVCANTPVAPNVSTTRRLRARPQMKVSHYAYRLRDQYRSWPQEQRS